MPAQINTYTNTCLMHVKRVSKKKVKHLSYSHKRKLHTEESVRYLRKCAVTFIIPYFVA